MDDGELIEQVQGFPALYNKKDRQYKDKNAKEQAWTTIGSVLGFTPQACEQRWVVLRAKYSRLKKEVRDMPSGSGAYTISWPYYNIMGFLDPFVVTRRTISNMKRKVSPADSSENSQEGPGQSQQQHMQFNTSNILSEAWDTISQITEESESFQMEGDETFQEISMLDESSISLPPTPTLGSEFNAKMAKLRKGVEGSVKGKRGAKTAQEAMCATITKAVENLSDMNRNRGKEEEDKNGNLSWAKSLAADMAVLNTQERIIFKTKVYALLQEILTEKDNQ